MALLACVNVGFIPSQYIAIAILRVIIGVGDITLIDAIDVAFVIKKMPITPSDFPLPVPPAVEQVQNATVKEGRDVTKECNVTTGTPPLTVFWENVKSGQITTGKLLNITNITRYQTEYRCVANNTCGRVLTTMFIDVQCKNYSLGLFKGYFYSTKIFECLFFQHYFLLIKF